MPWYGWVVVVTLALNMLMVISNIGKPREPTTPEVAMWVVVIHGLLIWAVVALGSR
jgi:hypothetical protein